MLPRLLINKLLRPGCLQWNEELISTLFNTRDREFILKSPLSCRNIEDALYWNLNRNGIYTVKSGYRALQNELMDDSFGIWKRLWQIHVPPKVKIFLWRVRSSVLLTACQTYSCGSFMSGLYCDNSAAIFLAKNDKKWKSK